MHFFSLLSDGGYAVSAKDIVPPTHPATMTYGGHGPLPIGQYGQGGKEYVTFKVKSPTFSKRQNIQFSKVVERY